MLKGDVVWLTTHVQTCLATNHVVASCVTTNFWLDKITRESRRTRVLRHLLQNKFALGLIEFVQHVQILLQKVELLSTFCNNFL